jgi:hypothetical protein
MEKFPPVSSELLAALEKAFPDQVPNTTDSDRKIWTKVGNVEVVRFLKTQFEAQNSNILDTKVITDVHS